MSQSSSITDDGRLSYTPKLLSKIITMVSWSEEAIAALLEAVIAVGKLSQPLNNYPFGRVTAWDPVCEVMEAKGFEFTRDAMQ